MFSLILLKNKVEHVEFALAQITTGYNLEDDRCECVALQDYKKNEQVIVTWSSVLPVGSSILLTTACVWRQSQSVMITAENTHIHPSQDLEPQSRLC